MKKITTAIIACCLLHTLQGQINDWEFKAPLPTPRVYCTSSVVDEKIYVIGGAYSPTESSDEVEVYDPVTDTWDTTRANLPIPIIGASAQAIDGKIYVAGGQDVYLGVSKNTLYVYDPALNSWTQEANMPTARGMLSTAVIDSKLYAIGGMTTWPARTNKMEVYDPATGEWQTLTPMPTARSGLRAEVLNGMIYVIGGTDAYYTRKEVQVYDPNAGTWTNAAQLPEPRYIFGSGVIYEEIYVFGGSPGGDVTFQDLLRYKPEDGWTELEENTMPEFKVAFASSVVDSCIYGMGGGLYPFFYPTLPGPKVTNTVLKYCVTPDGLHDKKIAQVPLKNYPNPFSTQTTITFELRRSTDITLQVFDLNGQIVATLYNGRQAAGEYTVNWDPAGLPAGVYLYKLMTDEGVATRKCMLK